MARLRLWLDVSNYTIRVCWSLLPAAKLLTRRYKHVIPARCRGVQDANSENAGRLRKPEGIFASKHGHSLDCGNDS